MESMTHYMELLATNQPWNLLIYMAVPVILAEILAVTEFFILFDRNLTGGLRTLNKLAGTIAGFYFTGIFIYLFKTAVIPLTMTGGWRGVTDVLAVGFYLSGVIPLLGISLLEIGLIYKAKSEEEKLKVHAIFVSIFLVVAHVAMIIGMLSPEVFSVMDSGMSGM